MDWCEFDLEPLCDEFEAAFETGSMPSIDAFLQRAPEPTRAALLKELLVLEFRMGNSGSIDLQAYEARFPAFPEVIAEALRIHEAEATGNFRAGKTPVEPAESSLPAARAVPTQIDRFLVERLLGRGGFGEVFLGRDPDLQRWIALKIPRRDRLWSAQELETFLVEARKMVDLKGPGMAIVYEVFRPTVDGQPTLCIVQEYIQGQNLAAWYNAQSKPIDPNRIAGLLAEIAMIVATAHSRGVIHRDLKPANILLADSGQPYLLDFGLALG